MMANRIFTLINLLLITAGVYFGVNTFYALLTSQMNYGHQTVPALDRRPSAVTKYTPPPRSDYQTIVERNLFNSGAQPRTPSEPQQADLELEKLEETSPPLEITRMGRQTLDRIPIPIQSVVFNT